MIDTPWGGKVFYRSETGSTMDDAQALEDGGAPDGSVAWAGVQTAGRGRHPGRRWHGNPGASLLFTVYWRLSRFQVPSFAPSLTVGLGVCLWLESLGLAPSYPVALKWPNDVYLGDRKVGGILVRRRWAGQGSLHAGIGLNLERPEAESFRTPPAGIAEAGRALSPTEALEGLLPFLARALAQPDPREACALRLWRLNEALSLSLPDGSVKEGVVRGLDASGALVLEGPGGTELIHSGE